MVSRKRKKTDAKIKVLFVASEVAPFEKTGGLADVTGSLPKELAKQGVEFLVVMPKYRGIPWPWKRIAPGVQIYFSEHEEYFNRAGLYGNERGEYPDNLARFSYFCHDALAACKRMGFKPDIVHAHDWQAALLPVLLKTQYSKDPFFEKTRSILTVHNLAYQGQFAHRQYGHLGLDPSLFSIDGFEFYGKINLLKAGLLFADRISTVSPTYAEEMKTSEFGYGLDGVVKKREKELTGILNGIDLAMWNPQKDKKISVNFSSANRAGKAKCKEVLQKMCGFEVQPDVPVFAIVSRLAEQKGLDLLSEILDTLLLRRVQFVILGDGEDAYKTTFRNVAKRHPKNAAAFMGFHAKEAHSIYAGADFFLMPSYFEPCGLGQMISMRYGTVPIVRRTGGLADTVIDVDADTVSGNGLVFNEKSPEKLLYACERAIRLFQNKERYVWAQKNAMSADFSWEKSSVAYKKLYQELLRAA